MKKFKNIFFVAMPFVLYGVFRGLLTPFLQSDPGMVRLLAIIGLSVFAVLIASQIIIKNDMYFPFAGFLVFLSYLGVSVLVPFDMWEKTIQNNVIVNVIIAKPEFVLYSSLFLIAFFPPILRIKPFTYYFARNMVEKQYQATRLYKWVNIIINYFWALLFSLAASSQFLNSVTARIAVSVVLQFGVGLFATKFLVKYLMRKLSYLEQGQSKDYLKSAKDAVSGMPYVFNKKEAGDAKMVIQFNISGSENFSGYLDVGNGKCSYNEGIHQNPSLTINSPADVWLDIAKGKLSGDKAFLSRMFLTEGDTGYLLKMNKMFSASHKEVKLTSQSLDTTSLGEKTYFKANPGEIKKILAIQASPRKSSTSKTEILLQAFLKGCKSAGADYEIVYLQDKSINFCTGCFSCWTKTPGRCIFDDDVKEIMQKEKEADLTVYAAPLYHFGIISKLKAYIERTLLTLAPYLVEDGGKTSHPMREGYENKNMYRIIMGVCGFPEVEHFKALSTHYHAFSASNIKNSPNKIIAEIYRPASETLGLSPFADENKRVLSACKKAGEQVVNNGYIEEEVIRDISSIGFDIGEFRKQANLSWDICIKEGKIPSQMQKELLPGLKLEI